MSLLHFILLGYRLLYLMEWAKKIYIPKLHRRIGGSTARRGQEARYGATGRRARWATLRKRRGEEARVGGAVGRDGGLGPWDGGKGGGDCRVSVVEAGRQGLVEAEFGLGITIREVEGGRLIEEEVTLWRAARGGEGWGAVWRSRWRRMAVMPNSA